MRAMLLLGLAGYAAVCAASPSKKASKVEHVDLIARKAMARRHAAEEAEQAGEGHGHGHGHGCAQQRLEEFAVSEQRYRGQGVEAAAQQQAKKERQKKAKGKRSLQTSSTGSPYSFSNTGACPVFPCSGGDGLPGEVEVGERMLLLRKIWGAL